MKKRFLKIQGGEATFPQGPPAWPVASADIVASVNDALSDGQWGAYEGPLLELTHRRLVEMWGLRETHLCASGTIAVELALRGCGVKPGDEVILAGYDFAGNFRAIEAIGAVPVLVDVQENGWTLNPERVAEAISEKTRAVLVSHLHGQPAEIASIVAIARSVLGQPPIQVVEDLCQSPGGMVGGKMLGTFADATTLSFGGSKLLSAGRGGAVLCRDPAIVQRIKVFAHRGNDAFPLSQIQAALLLPQLDCLSRYNDLRRAAGQRIAAAVNRLEHLRSLDDACFGQRDGPAIYKLPLLLKESAPFTRAEFLATIQPEGIGIDSGFRGFAKRSGRRCRKAGELPNAIVAAERTMVLHHPVLMADDETIDQLIQTIERVHEYCSARLPGDRHAED